jgi:hypothetical protein
MAHTDTKKMFEMAYKNGHAISTFDVFLAHNSADKAKVRVISEQLKRRRLKPWLDIEQIPPGRCFQDIIQEAIPKVKSAAVIVGKKGLGRWEIVELRAFISQCVERGMPVIPVLLPGVTKLPSKLAFLKEFNRIRFTKSVDDTKVLDSFEWGITGKRPKKGKLG